jgi:ketopantoate reductase
MHEALRAWTNRIGKEGQASTLMDFKRGRRMEADSINGLVVEKAEECGVSAPYHAEIVKLTHRLERGEIKQGLDTIKHLVG